MGVNGITSFSITDQYVANTTLNDKNSSTKTEETTSKAEETGVVYEKSTETTSTKKNNSAIVAQLKAEQEKRDAQFKNIVLDTISKQGNAYGQATDIWKFLASGDFTVDAATKAKAQEDISEDGYWGVKATSDRIVDFAKALSGGDASKIDLLKDAFEKGFKQATKTWGSELPSISQDTYKAVMDKFDAWEKEANGTSKEEETDSSSTTDVNIQLNSD